MATPFTSCKCALALRSDVRLFDYGLFQTSNDRPMPTNDPFGGGLDWADAGSDQLREKRDSHWNSKRRERLSGRNGSCRRSYTGIDRRRRNSERNAAGYY